MTLWNHSGKRRRKLLQRRWFRLLLMIIRNTVWSNIGNWYMEENTGRIRNRKDCLHLWEPTRLHRNISIRWIKRLLTLGRVELNIDLSCRRNFHMIRARATTHLKLVKRTTKKLTSSIFAPKTTSTKGRMATSRFLRLKKSRWMFITERRWIHPPW